MPQAITFVSTAIEAAATGVGYAGFGAVYAVTGNLALANAVGSALVYASQAAIYVGLNSALQPHIPGPEAGKVNVRQSLPSRQFGVGRCRVPGAYALRAAKGNVLHSVLLWPIGGGAPLAVGRTWLNDDLVTVASGVVQQLPDGRYQTGLVKIETRQGLASETGYGALTAEYPAWPSTARGDYLPSSWLRLQNGKLADFNRQFPAGPCELTEEHFYAAYDWRDEAQDRDDPSTWTHSRNPVVWLVNILWRAYGADWTLRFSRALAALAAEADVCDESVSRIYGSASVVSAVAAGGTSLVLTSTTGLAAGATFTVGGVELVAASVAGATVGVSALTLPVTAGDVARWTVDPDLGLTEPRYEVGFFFALSTPASEIIQTALKSMDGWFGVARDGSFIIRAGHYVAPTVIFGDEELIDVSFNAGPPPDQAINVLAASFTDPDAAYSAVETTQRRAEADIELRGERIAPFAPPGVQSPGQVGRLALIALDKGLAPNGTFRTPLSARRGLGQRFVGVRCSDEADLADAVVEIVKVKTDLDTASILWTYNLVRLNEDAAAVRYVWDAAAMEGEPSGGAPLPSPEPLAPPTISDAAAFFDGDGAARLELTGSGPDRDDLTWWIGWRLAGDTAFVDAVATDLDPSTPVVLQSGVVPSGASLEARIGYQTGGGSLIWSDPSDPIDTTPAPGAPATPFITDYAGGAGAADITWLNPTVNFHGARVWAGASGSDFDDATDASGLRTGAPGAPDSDHLTGLAAGSWDLWVTAESAGGDASPPAGPVTVTVS